MPNILNPDKWIDSYADYLYRFALYRINDKEQAEDLVQETFLSAYKNLSQYRGEANEKTWLTTILKNKIIDFYRKNAKRLDVNLNESDYDYYFVEGADGHWKNQTAPNDLQLSGLDTLQRKEMQSIVDICLSLLPNTWNQISKMKLIDEEKTETICKLFNITPSNFWVIMHRAKLQLRDCIEKKWIHA